MKEFNVSVSWSRHKSKTDGYGISEDIGNSPHTINQDNLKRFVTLLSGDGITFCPATFRKAETKEELSEAFYCPTGLKRENNVEQTQLFVLEFNNDNPESSVTFDQIKERADGYNLPILFAYRPFSVSNDPCGFTVAFLNDARITSRRAANIIGDALMTVFPESNPECIDITRIYFGGNQPPLYVDESVPETNIDSLIRSMTIWLRDRYGDTYYKKKIVEFADRHKLKLTPNNLIDIKLTGDSMNHRPLRSFYKNSPSSIISIIIENGENLQYYQINFNNTSVNSSGTESGSQRESKVHKKHRSEAIDKIRSVCHLFREFDEGSRELNANELFTLAATLINVESDSKRFLNTIQKHCHHPSYSTMYSYWVKNLSIMSQKEYEPIGCGMYCPYRAECHHSGHILDSAKPRPHTTTRLANCGVERLSSVEAASDDFRRHFTAAAEAHDANIHAINAPVGVGKSTMAIDYIAEHQDKRFLYACSTNDLKNELYDKSKYKFDAVTSPSLYESKDKLPPQIWKRIERLHQSGKHHMVYDYIREVAAKKAVPAACIDILKKYLNDLTAFNSSGRNAFTTHSRLMTMDYWSLKKYDGIIIDEDPLMNHMLPNQVEIPVTELEKVLAHIDKNCELAKKITTAAEAAATHKLFTVESISYDGAYDAISTDTDIASFCRAEKFYAKTKSEETSILETANQNDSIVFFRPFRLHPRIKHIILSATIDRRIYNCCFGANRVRFYEGKKAELTGTLNQYFTRMSRASISETPEILKHIKEWTKVRHTITFKKFCGQINATLHFGKVTGVDFLKGEDIDVVGTPHTFEWLPKLFLYTMGHDIDGNAKLRYQKVRHNGYQFWFMTFDDQLLKDTQFWLIESELSQSAGRARLTREKCTVNVFSDFPLPQSTNRFLFEYDNGDIKVKKL